MAKYWMGIASLMILAGSTLAACTDAPVDIGEKNPQLAKSDLAAYAASWDGYVEAYQFEDGTDRVRLVLDEQGQGTLRFGERELFGPAISPIENYPPQSAGFYAAYIWSGFGYTVRNARIESERIRFTMALDEVYASYCALQSPDLTKPTETGAAPYYCILDTSSESVGSSGCSIAVVEEAGVSTLPVNCQQAGMCFMSHRCSCTATSCTVDTADEYVEFDTALDDSQQNLFGTMVSGGERLTVHLKR